MQVKSKLLQFRFAGRDPGRGDVSFAYTTICQMIRWANENASPEELLSFLGNKDFVYKNFQSFVRSITDPNSKAAREQVRYVHERSESVQELLAGGIIQQESLGFCEETGRGGNWLRLIPIDVAQLYLTEKFPLTTVFKTATLFIPVDDPKEAKMLNSAAGLCRALSYGSAAAPKAVPQNNNEDEEVDVGLNSRQKRCKLVEHCVIKEGRITLGMAFKNLLGSDFVIFSVLKSNPMVLGIRAGNEDAYSESFHGKKTSSSMFTFNKLSQKTYLGQLIEDGKYAARWDNEKQRVYIDFNRRVDE